MLPPSPCLPVPSERGPMRPDAVLTDVLSEDGVLETGRSFLHKTSVSIRRGDTQTHARGHGHVPMGQRPQP